MKRRIIIFVFLALLSCIISCQKTQEDSGEPENSIFKNDLLKGVSQSLDHYWANKEFNIEETRRGPADPRKFPLLWYTAKNDAIEIAFWPDGELYRLQWVDVKQRTRENFLGRFIGMTRTELLKKYPDTSYIEDNPQGENHIMYYSADGKRLINFWLEDNDIVRVGFAYSFE